MNLFKRIFDGKAEQTSTDKKINDPICNSEQELIEEQKSSTNAQTKHGAQQKADSIKVIQPQSLIETIKRRMENAVEQKRFLIKTSSMNLFLMSEIILCLNYYHSNSYYLIPENKPKNF